MINALKENAEALQQAAPQAALGVMGDTLRVVFSPAVWIAAFVLSALFPLLAGLITRRVPAGLMCGGAAYFVSGAGILITNAVSETVMKTLRFDDGVFKCAWRQAYDLRSGSCWGGRSAYRGIYRREGHVGKETQKRIKYTAVRKDRRFYSPSAVSCIQYRRRQKGE